MADDERPAAYEEDERVIYRASSFGGCLISLAGLRMGYEPSPPPQSMVDGVFARGHELEKTAIKNLKADGWGVKDQQREFDLHLTSRALLRCHVDGIAESVVVEIKSQSEDEYDKWHANDPWRGDLWSKYAWQVSAVMLATGKSCALVRITPELRFDKVIVKEPPHSLVEMRQRHFAIEKIVRSGVLPTCEHPMFPCPLWRLHPPKDEPPTIDLDDTGIDEHAKIYDHARKEESKWAGIKEAARRALRLGIVPERVRTKSGIVVSFIPTKRRVLSDKKLEDKGLTRDDVTVEELGERIDVSVPEVVKDAQ